jgi:hypothetical protein
MKQQPSDQPEIPTTTNGNGAVPRPPEVDPWFVSADECQALLRKQVALSTQGNAARREIAAAARYAAILETQTFEMHDNGRTAKQVANGTTLTPDQDALAMDATIPRCPRSSSDE